VPSIAREGSWRRISTRRESPRRKRLIEMGHVQSGQLPGRSFDSRYLVISRNQCRATPLDIYPRSTGSTSDR